MEYNWFSTMVYYDVLLMKEIPEDFPYTVSIMNKLDDSLIIEQIVCMLADMKNWDYTHLYILYTLKDFPQYYLDDRIRKYLIWDKLQEVCAPYPHLAHAADWVIGI